jgi:ribosomal protein S18 acetylase RimI-like enzyme
MNKRPRARATATDAGYAIREMAIEDLPKVFALGQRLFTAERWPTLYRSWDQYEIVELFDSDGEFCLVAETERRIVGFALGTLMEKRGTPWRYGWLLWLGISQRYRGRGIAARLLNRLADLFIRQGARIMLVDTDAANERALHFFREQGFGNDLMHVYLSRSLAEHPSYIQLRARKKRIRSLRRRRLLGSRVVRGKKSKR